MDVIRLDILTSAGGAATVTSTIKVLGRLYAVQLVDGSLDDGVDVTLTCESPDYSIPLLTKADFNADGFYYPRALAHGVEDGAALTGTAGGDRVMPIVAGELKAVIAQGGNAKTGAVICYIV